LDRQIELALKATRCGPVPFAVPPFNGATQPPSARSNASRPVERKLIEMVMEGVAPSVVKDELNPNAAKREQLEAKLAVADEPRPLLHPEKAPSC
jgi:hypothetical protein